MAYEKLRFRLDSGWDKTFDLIKKGQKDGEIRPVDENIIKLMYESCIDRLLMGDYLQEAGKDYPKALAEVVDIMVDGIVK